MGIVRYIAQGITEARPEGLYRFRSGINITSYSYVKIEEKSFDPKTKVSVLSIELVSKTNAKWYSKDYLNLDGFGIKVDGQPIVMQALARGDGLEDTYAVIAECEYTLPARTAAKKSCTVSVYAPDPNKAYDGSAAWEAFTMGAMPAAKVGSYEFPLSAVKSGSSVYIGGEAYGVYIGNGSGLDRYDIYIGGEKY